MKLRRLKLLKEDIPLIKRCINHWKRLKTGKFRRKEDPYSGYCSLCRKYCTHPVDRCKIKTGEQCPLAQVYGSCENSKIENPWSTARYSWRFSWGIGVEPAECQLRDMQAMIDALESLLPDKEN